VPIVTIAPSRSDEKEKDLIKNNIYELILPDQRRRNHMRNKIVCMKLMFVSAMLFTMILVSSAADLKPIKLNPPSKDRGFTVMKSLSVRASAREYSDKSINLQDLSDLLWAANGINRPDKGLRTASSGMNAQDIDIYVILENGAYLYNAQNNSLEPVNSGDFRSQIAGQSYVKTAPVNLLLVSDMSRFKRGDDESKLVMAALDAGIVSQNISLYCASVGLVTVPRVGVEIKKMEDILKLKKSQRIFMNHPVGYPK
jgi:SagB-type dehydrogenase family enzyme